ncbi:hybrid sensor histidine kinase/response regulator [Lacipirellula limnantheis]|uniref:histidine kinase n=1 Tax=Lacipirellula limnantheis TaxID=2528024 RepID=A0A517U3C3_9BACT|nr:ATP-binding protein [Lacipirellula limnantheis]QDT75125.1 Sensor histidine kinase TmoS [Lacipirellula limnantheis]
MATDSASLETRVLLLPPTSRDADAIGKLLRDAGIDCITCPSPAAMAAAIGDGAAAAVVSEESLIGGDHSLAECLAAQPVWSDLPVIVLSRSGVEPALLGRALQPLGNVSILERPVRVSTFLSIVRTALRARDRQYQVRDHLLSLDRIAAELRQRRAQQELIVRGANIGVWTCPLPFDRLLWDDAVKSHFHLPPDAEVTIDLFYDRLHPDDRQRTRQAIEASIVARTAYDVDYRTVSPDGSQTKWIRAMGRGFYDDAGDPVRFDGITIDVTERKMAELDRERLLDSERAARNELERANQMKDEFLATLSHELRNPLNAILGWAQILRSNALPPAETAEGIEVIERNARAQAQIIEDLLDMSRIISGKVRLDVQRVDLAAVIRAAIETIKPAADAKGIRLRAVLDPLVGPVSGDPNRLQQVFWNLLSNAVKFTPRGGAVQILLERINSHLEVSVIDSGEGIDPEFLPHVFDRFRQADASTTRKHGGLGLGLAIVRQLVELHGGRVHAKSAGLGAGATFVVHLPMTVVVPDCDRPNRRRHPAASAIPTSAESCAEIAGVTVVVVDDEPDARGLLRRLLEDCDAIVFDAANAADALELVQAKRPDVLVSDIGMPGEDGYSLIRRLRQLPYDQGGATPAVALTAYARADDRVNVVLAGFQHHLSKPVEPAELIAIIASLAHRV